jgi:hypothetical protein
MAWEWTKPGGLWPVRVVATARRGAATDAWVWRSPDTTARFGSAPTDGEWCPNQRPDRSGVEGAGGWPSPPDDKIRSTGFSAVRARGRAGGSGPPSRPASFFTSRSTARVWAGTIRYGRRTPEESARATATISTWTSTPINLMFVIVGDGFIRRFRLTGGRRNPSGYNPVALPAAQSASNPRSPDPSPSLQPTFSSHRVQAN